VGDSLISNAIHGTNILCEELETYLEKVSIDENVDIQLIHPYFKEYRYYHYQAQKVAGPPNKH